jgi:hypothetical protein
MKNEVLSIRIENLELVKKIAKELGITVTELVVQAIQDKYNLDLSSSKISKRNAEMDKKLNIVLKQISGFQGNFDILEFNIKKLSEIIEIFENRISVLEKDYKEFQWLDGEYKEHEQDGYGYHLHPVYKVKTVKWPKKKN